MRENQQRTDRKFCLFIGHQPCVLRAYCQKNRLEAKISASRPAYARETPLKREHDVADSRKD